MPATAQHRRMTANALNLVPELPGPRSRLTEEFCLYPDQALNAPEEFARYCRLPSGEWFHYLPDVSYAELYRYHTVDCAGHIRRARAFRNGNYDFALPGFLHLLRQSATQLGDGKEEEAMKYLGVLLHVLQDACFGIHALEGPGGSDLFFFDRLRIGDFSPAEVLARLDCSDFPFFSAAPRMLGTSVPEAALRLYAHYCRTARAARRSCMEILLAHWNGKNENTAPCLSMYRNAVLLCADVLKTVSELATGKTEASPYIPLAELEPYEFPVGGYGAYRFRTQEIDCYYTPDGQKQQLTFPEAVFHSGLSFGLSVEQNLLYHLPEKTFDRFSGTLLLSGEKDASVHCRLVNRGTVVRKFVFDADHPVQTVNLSDPAGEFGFRLTSEAPFGIMVLGDGQICAGRLASGEINSGTDGRASGKASRKSQKKEAAS